MEGKPDGEMLGTRVGTSEGDWLGFELGASEGDWLGVELGEGLGLELGTSEGATTIRSATRTMYEGQMSWLVDQKKNMVARVMPRVLQIKEEGNNKEGRALCTFESFPKS